MLLASTIKQPLQFRHQELDNNELNRRLASAQLHVVRRDKIVLFVPGTREKGWDPYLFQAIRELLIDSMSVRRFKDGFLVQSFDKRHFIFCHLQVFENVIHPILIPTPFLPLNLPLPQGAPITLLPYATPAYFLAEYTGPSTALVKQFQAAFQGLGVGDWGPSFIIAWIKVENKQGEDKGLSVIYPTDLCVSTPRQPLEYIPELPTPLQPSPQIVPIPRRSLPALHSLSYLRPLTVSKFKDIRQTAAEVSGYVDTVAREREKERERLKRERESATSSPKMTRTPVESAPLPILPQPPQPQLIPGPLTTSQSTLPQSVIPQPPSQQAPQQQQTFYPSPPVIPPPASLQPAPPVNAYDPFAMDTDMVWGQSNTDYLDMGSMAFDFNPSAGGGDNEHERGFMEDAFTDDDFNFFDQHKSSIPPRPPSPPPLWSATPSAFILGDGFTPQYIDSIPPELVASSAPTPETSGGSVPSTPNVHLEIDPHDRAPRGPFEPIPFASYHRKADGKYAVGKFAFSLPSPPEEEDEMIFKMSLNSPPTTPGGGGGAFRAQYDAKTDPRISMVKQLKQQQVGKKRKAPYEHVLKESPSPPSWMTLNESIMLKLKEEEDEKMRGLDSDEDSDEDADEDEDIDSPMLSRPATPPPSYLPLGPTLIQTRFQHAHLLPLSVPLRPPGAAIAHNINPIHPSAASVPTPVSPAAVLGAANERSKSLEAAAFAIAAEVVENPVWADTWRSVNFPSILLSSSLSGTMGATREVWGADIKAVSKLLASVKYIAGIELEAPVSMEALFGLEQGKQLQPLPDPMISIGKGEALVDIETPALRFWEKLGLGPKSGRKNLGAFVLYDECSNVSSSIEGWLKSVMDVYQAKRYGTMTAGQSTVSKGGLVPLRLDATFRKSLTTLLSNISPSDQQIHVVFLIIPTSMMSLTSPVLRQILAALRKVLSVEYTKGQFFFQFIPEPHILIAQEKSPAFDSPLDQLSASVYTRILIPVDRLRSKGVQERVNEKLEEKHELGYDYFEGYNQTLRKSFMAPAFTLARPLESIKASYVRAKHASLDVMDRYALLHVAYQLSECGKWILACVVDWRGDAYDLRVWLTQRGGNESGPGGDCETENPGSGADVEDASLGVNIGQSVVGGYAGQAGQGSRGSSTTVDDEEYVVKKVWEFGMDFAKRANIEWRIVFARLGIMNEKEMNAWSNMLNTNVVPSREQPPLHHSVVCVVPNAPWHFIPSNKEGIAPPLSRPQQPRLPLPSATASKQPPIFKDISSTTFAIYPTIRMPMSSPPSLDDLGISQSFIPEQPPPGENAMQMDDDFHTDNTRHPVLPELTSILVRVPHPSLSAFEPVSMTHIHLLTKTAHSASYQTLLAQGLSESAKCPDDKQLMEDVTKNYFALGVLGRMRWYLEASAKRGLPFHVAAIETMRMALDKDWERLEVGMDV